MINFRTALSTNAPSINVTVKGTDVMELNIVNRHSAAIFVKFYDSTVATFQDVPLRTFEVKANDSYTNTAFVFSSYNGLCVRTTTGATDSDNTAPGTLPIIELYYSI